MVAKTFQGLEDVLRDELISLGAENVEMGRRMVSFEGDLALMYKANLCCRTALRILKPIEKFTAHDPDELYDIVRDIPWEKYMSPQTTFAIDSTVNSDEFTHSKFVTYRVKDGIVDHFRDLTGERPSIRVAGADLMLNVHIFEDRVTISLDSSGEPLSKRGYRVAQTEAPINEVLAAGIIMKTGWRGDCNFVDPMCGSGTFLIEAALIAANINPGIYRENFAFEKWPDFDKDLFEELYNDDSAEREFDFKIYGGDIDPDAVAIARRNVKMAKVDDMVELTCRPMSDWIDNPEDGILVMNPPYGARLKPDDMTELYKGIGSCLKKNFPGYHAWIIGMN
ncbi:MAG: RNA methyltransferase, partial [Muribaculaceae bacterium]|nr:RNA methyltransferase [Muribaculaceae bacterium]